MSDRSASTKIVDGIVWARVSGPRAILALCKRIIIETGRPLTRGQLMERLESAGTKLSGKDKESRARYVGTILWRSRDEIENIEGLGYWLRGERLPEGLKSAKEKRPLVK